MLARSDLAKVTKDVAERDTVGRCLFWGHVNFKEEADNATRRKPGPKGGVASLEAINVMRAHSPGYVTKGAVREHESPRGLRSLPSVRCIEGNPSLLRGQAEAARGGSPACFDGIGDAVGRSESPRAKRIIRDMWPWQRRELEIRRAREAAEDEKKHRLARIAERLDRLAERRSQRNERIAEERDNAHAARLAASGAPVAEERRRPLSARPPRRPPVPGATSSQKRQHPVPTPPAAVPPKEKTSGPGAAARPLSARLKAHLDRIEALEATRRPPVRFQLEPAATSVPIAAPAVTQHAAATNFSAA